MSYRNSGKRLISMALLICMLAATGLFATISLAGAQENNQLSIAVKLSSTSVGTDKVWFWQWARDHFDMDFEIVEVPQASLSDWKSLAFASDDLPDVLLGCYLSADDLVNYGALEGQLIDLAPYATNAEIMPNLAALLAAHPEYKTAISTADGQIFGLGAFRNSNPSMTYNTYFVNKDYLAKAGVTELPTTLEGVVDMLRAFQKLEGVVPCEGFYKSVNIQNLIFSSMGIIANGSNGIGPALKYTNGQAAQVILPYADEETYTYFLQTMNTLFTEGLITDDFYTQTNSNQIKANVAEGKSAMICHNLNVYAINEKERYTNWQVLAPVTSALNDTPVWRQPAANISVGQAAVTAHCENPELACRFLDWFYDKDNYFRHEFGFLNGDAQNYAYGGFMVDDAGVLSHYDVTVNHMDESESMYVYTYQQGFDTAAVGYGPANYKEIGYVEAGKADLFKPADQYGEDTVNNYQNLLYQQALTDEVTRPAYPGIVFFTPDESAAITALKSNIDSYVEGETAKFITGVRALSEIPNFFSELKNLGVDELLSYYVNYYEAIQ